MKKRADGRYQKQIVVGYRPDGSPIRKSVYGKTIREVEEKILELKGQMWNGIRLDNNMTFRDACELYLDRPIKATTRSTYAAVLHHFDSLMRIPVRDINTIMIKSQLKGMSEPSQKLALIVCGAIMKYLVDNNVIEKNPCKGIKLTYEPQKREALTLEQQKVVLDAPSCQAKNALLLMMLCGLRFGEAMAITRKDIHDGIVDVTKQKNNVGKLTTPKTKSSVRQVPCPRMLYEEIKDQMIVVPGSRITVRSFIKKLGLDITPHQLRHTYATNLFNSDVNVKTAQIYLGHSSLSMTMDIYTHLTEERSKSEMTKYEEYLKRLKS